MIQEIDLNYSEKDLQECSIIYRHLHQYPQIGLLQFQTSNYIRNILNNIPGIEIDPPLQNLKSAIIVRLYVQNPINCILLRTELDALNWKQESDLPFKSENGLHHACGHDGHMASLITAIKMTARNKNKLRRNLIFCFQPGQEGKGGASKLFSANPNILDGVDECYAIHFSNGALPGKIFLGKGPITSLSSKLTIKIEGYSAHPMMPYAGVDANFIGCTLVTQIYSLISMKVPPLEGATIVIYYVNGGANVTKVSDSFQLMGTVRATTISSFQVLKSTITKLVEGLCTAYGAKKPTITLNLGNYRPVVNDEKVTAATRKKLEESIKDLIIDENQKSFAGEDFCEFSERRPSCYIAVGSAVANQFDPITQQSKFPAHNSKHKFDEKVFETSVKIWQAIIFK